MKCPRCNVNITSDDFYCKHCGKVLKVECPRCGTINKKSLCSKCKLKLLVKCSGCGNTNPVSSIKCRKCNTSTIISLDIQDAKIQEFAIICLELSNHKDVKKTLGTGQLYNNFKNGLYKVLQQEASKYDVRIDEIQEGLISVRLSKYDTFKDSCNAAVQLSLDLAAVLSKINLKLVSSKDIALKVKIGITVGNVFDRRTTAREERSISSKDTIEIIANQLVFNQTKDAYKYEQIVSVFVKNQILTFYKLISDTIEELDTEYSGITAGIKPKYSSYSDKNDGFRLEFTERRCNLVVFSQSKLQIFIEDLITNSPKGNLINVISDIDAGKLNNLSKADLKTKFEDYKFYNICCLENSKYYPFGLFRNIIRSYFGFNEIELEKDKEKYFLKNKLNSIIGLDKAELENLLLIQSGSRKNIDELKDKIFEQIKKFFNAVSSKGKLVFIIEDFENIDKGSLDCFSYLVNSGILDNITFIICSSLDFNLSKKIFKLNSLKNYNEIILRPDPNEEFDKNLELRVKNIAKNFLFKKVLENSKGSSFYIEQALHYLIDNGIFRYESGIIKQGSNKIISVPKTLDEVIRARIEKLLNDPVLGDIYLKLILLGPRVSIEILRKMDSQGIVNKLKTMAEMGLLEYSSQLLVSLKNYNLFRKVSLSLMEESKLEQITKELCSNFNFNLDYTHPIVAECMEYADYKKESWKLWNKLAQLALLIGDISTFTQCSIKFLNLIEAASLNKHINAPEYNAEKVQKIKLDIYEQISKLAYEYSPEEAIYFLKEVINGAEANQDDERVIKMSSLMVQSCNLSGNYVEALEYLGKIIVKTPKDFLDIKSKNFNIKFYLTNFIKIQALFNLGKIEESIVLAEEILSVLKSVLKKNILPEGFPPTALDSYIRDTELLLIKARLLQLKPVSNDISRLYSQHPDDKHNIEILDIADKVRSGCGPEIREQLVNLPKNSNFGKENKLSCGIIHILYNMQYGKWRDIADTAYSLRSVAFELKDYQSMYFLDLMIGLAYKEINNYKKAEEIYQAVLKESAEKNILNIMLLSWYLIADLNLHIGQVNISYEIINKANRILERQSTSSKLFSIYFKYLFTRIFKAQGNLDMAKQCIVQAHALASKHGLEYNQVLYSKMLIEIIIELLKKTDSDKDSSIILQHKEQIEKSLKEIDTLTQKIGNPYLLNKVQGILSFFKTDKSADTI